MGAGKVIVMSRWMASNWGFSPWRRGLIDDEPSTRTWKLVGTATLAAAGAPPDRVVGPTTVEIERPRGLVGLLVPAPARPAGGAGGAPIWRVASLVCAVRMPPGTPPACTDVRVASLRCSVVGAPPVGATAWKHSC